MTPTPSESDLRIARAAAVDASMEADRLETSARRARRIANSKTQHYEDLLMAFQGQLTIDDEEEE